MTIINFFVAFCASVILFLFGVATAAVAQSGNGLLLVVDSTADGPDASAGDGVCADANGKCTLRAAIDESNSTTASTAIIFDLPKPAVIELALGELSIQRGTDIVGPGARLLTVQRSSAAGTPNFRIFHIVAGRTGASIRGMTIRNGSSDTAGGGALVESDSYLGLSDVAVSGNRAATGGGIGVIGKLVVLRSLISGNTADGEGGGIANIDGAPDTSITSSTLTNNTAATGGAISNRGNLLLVNCTVARNSASTASSIVNGGAGSGRVLNTIIGSDAPAPATALQGTFQSAGKNIVTDARGSSGFANGVNGDQVSDNNAIDPKLGDLADNGGQTDTLALLVGSPAIDNGDVCAASGHCTQLPGNFFAARRDQRLKFRSFGPETIDIGAYEAHFTNVTGSGSLSFSFSPGVGRFLNSPAILINATTFEKQFSVVRLDGSMNFKSISPDHVYVLDIRAKRSGALTPFVFEIH